MLIAHPFSLILAVAFSLITIAHGAAIPTAPQQELQQLSYTPQLKASSGILGSDLCDDVSDRFFKFGQCIAATPQFQYLNQTFWYQAARKELCGYDMQYQWPSEEDTKNRNATQDKSTLLRLLGIQQKTALQQQQPGSHNTNTTFQDDIRLELLAEYLYLKRLAAQLNSSSIAGNSNLAGKTYDRSNANQTTTLWSDDELAMMKRDGTTPILTSNQCLTLCNYLQQTSNMVENCWQVTGLTVLYGVCEAGCHYFL